MTEYGANINVGCGMSPTEGWLNFDNSVSIRFGRNYWFAVILHKMRIISKSQIEFIRFCQTHDIKYANATRNIPVKAGTANCVYSSHMVEHLSRPDVERFLIEVLRVLRPKGTIRIAIPNLSHFVKSYMEHKDANRFMREMVVEAPSIDTWRGKLSLLLTGYRHHQWMYDARSIKKLVEDHGFANVTILNAGETGINQPGELNLFERSDQSLYLEGTKV